MLQPYKALAVKEYSFHTDHIQAPIGGSLAHQYEELMVFRSSAVISEK